MDLNFDLKQRYELGLRKWDKYGPEFIPAWIAEHDFGSPPAVKERLHALVSSEAFGYHDQDRRLGNAFSSWSQLQSWEFENICKIRKAYRDPRNSKGLPALQ